MEVRSIGIVGAGDKGRQVALLALLAGYCVVLEDMSVSRLESGKAFILTQLDERAARGALDARRRAEIPANLLTTQSVDEVSRRGDLLIDAAPEDAELQLEIFTIFDKFAKPNAILATTADSVAIGDLAEMTNCQERCVGLRFPERIHESAPVAIVPAAKTSDCAVQACIRFVSRLGLHATVVGRASERHATERASQ